MKKKWIVLAATTALVSTATVSALAAGDGSFIADRCPYGTPCQDADQDGVCDVCGRAFTGMKTGRGFIDNNGDGVCDHRAERPVSGSQGARHGGRHHQCQF